jgi:hypothetical protein
VPAQFGHDDRKLVAERHRNGVLAVGAPGHGRFAIDMRLAGKGRDQQVEVALDDGKAILELQDESGVDDVLGGGAPVHVLSRLTGEALQRPDRRHQRMA